VPLAGSSKIGVGTDVGTDVVVVTSSPDRGSRRMGSQVTTTGPLFDDVDGVASFPTVHGGQLAGCSTVPPGASSRHRSDPDHSRAEAATPHRSRKRTTEAASAAGVAAYGCTSTARSVGGDQVEDSVPVEHRSHGLLDFDTPQWPLLP
jgi:hypothetical protein